MKEIIIDLRKINKTYLISFLTTIVVAILMLIIKTSPIYFKWRWIVLLFIVAVIILHEAIHAIGFILFAKVPLNKVKFGFHRQYYVPYCSAEGIMSKFGYIAALLLPNIVLGSIGIISLYFTNNAIWSIFVAWLIASGSGDYYMLILVSKYNRYTRFIDHPSEPGFFVME